MCVSVGVFQCRGMFECRGRAHIDPSSFKLRKDCIETLPPGLPQGSSHLAVWGSLRTPYISFQNRPWAHV